MDSGTETYLVVLNDEEQYSIWPVGPDLPPGWRGDGFTGSQAECLTRIDKVWTDMRPLSLRQAMEREATDMAPGLGSPAVPAAEPSGPADRDRYLDLFADAAARRQAEIREQSLMSGEEAKQLAAWSRGPASAPFRPVTAQIAEQIQRAPEAVAVTGAAGSLTYRGLGSQASLLASALAALGVRPESLVAIRAGRSADLVVAELAVLAAGAAYLPLSPDFPSALVSERLGESGATALLTTSQLAGELPGVDLPVLLLDQPGDWGAPPADRHGAGAGRFTPVPVRADSLAYVIYPPGSKGRPKGVQATHGGLANVAAWSASAYELAPGHRSTLLCKPAFDGSVWEIWSTLSAGGTLAVPPEEVIAVPGDLARWMAAQQVAWSYLPTPLAEAMLLEDWSSGTALRFLCTGGHALRREIPPGMPFRVVNHYGPTETTVINTWTELSPGESAMPPIGRPLAGARTYVLSGRVPVPVEVAGELCIGGTGVSRGYLGEPSATAAVFIPDPFEPGQRIYRTGDRARWRPDGRIEILEPLSTLGRTVLS